MVKTYRVRPDVTPEQIAAAIDALNPFYAFGCVLDTANEENGSACIALHDGNNDTADDPMLSLAAISPDGELLSIAGSWTRVPAAYIGPTLTAKDFFAARDAFLACIENINPGE